MLVIIACTKFNDNVDGYRNFETLIVKTFIWNKNIPNVLNIWIA